MSENEAGSEQDDVSFLRTDDMLCLQSTATGTRVCLAAEGFGNRHCYLENITDKNFPPELSSCVFVIEQALSVRALQEMVTAESHSEFEKPNSKGVSGGGSRTLLYGHAVLLKHGHSKMYFACLSSTSSSSDKLAFDVGLQEHSQGEACWWTVHPASKQRSEGEKVRVGDEIILVSVATERYLHTAKEDERNIVDASFKLTHWSVAPYGTGLSRAKNVGFVFGGDVLRFYHGGDECLTVSSNWSEAPGQNIVVYEGGPVLSQARSLWRLELIRTKWAGGFINWGYPLRIVHIITGRCLAINSNNEVWLVSRENATVAETAFCLKQNKDDKKIAIDEKEEEVIGLPLIKYGDTSFFLQHIESNCWLSYKSYETKKRHIGRVEEKQAILSEEGKMDDGLEFSRSQEEEAKTARVIRKCGIMFNKFIQVLDSLHKKRFHNQNQNLNLTRSDHLMQINCASPIFHQNQVLGVLSLSDQEEMIMCLEDLIAYFEQPEEDIEHEEKQLKLKALRNRQDLFQEEGILVLILETIDKINSITNYGLLSLLLGEESSPYWDLISTYLYQLLAAVIKGNHTNCAQFAQAHRLDWLFSRFSSQAAGEGTGMLDVLHCVLTDSPEALNMMKENHIKVIISLLEKHGRDPKVLEVLCSLCVGNGVAVRSSQNNICDNLLPGRNLLLQTRLVGHVASMRPNIYVGKIEGSAMYRKWYLELAIDYLEQVTHLDLHFRIGWASTLGYVPYPGGGPKWGGNGVGDDFFSYGFDGKNFWTSGISNEVRTVKEGEMYLKKGDIIGCILDLDIPLITFTINGVPVRGCFKNFNTDGMFYPVVSFSAKWSCRFLFGGHHGRLKFGPPMDHAPLVEALLPGQKLQIDNCFQFGELPKNIIYGPPLELIDEAAFVPHPVDTSNIVLPSLLESIKEKLAENMHEVWSMNKIISGWVYGEYRDDINLKHPSLTSFEKLPVSEKDYITFLALEVLKTILALGFKISLDKPPGRIKILRLPNEPFLQNNGYKPAPLDLTHIKLTASIEDLIEYLAENTHNVWSAERIKQNWTYGFNDDLLRKRSSHLVPYKYVDDIIKKNNINIALELVKTLIAYGYVFEQPTSESSEIEAVLGKIKPNNFRFRSYRAEKTYAVMSGKWYFEVEILSKGSIRVGWATLRFSPSRELGKDEYSWSFDCYQVRKFHADASESFGKSVNYGDVIGCFLDLNDRTIGFSLNGELLLDASGGEAAFIDITLDEEGFVPAITLGSGQKVRLIFGQDVNSLKFFTVCGLQDGYQPFCINMNRNMPLWYNKDEPLFLNVKENNSNVDVIRISGGSDSSPALKIVHKLFEFQEKVSWEFLRLSLPVTCNEKLITDHEKQKRWEEMIHQKRKKRVEEVNIHHPTNLEQHMLQSGFSLADVKDLQRTYSEDPTFTDDIDSALLNFSNKSQFTPTAIIQKPNPTFIKTKTFENSLTIPSFAEAQAIMKEKDNSSNKSSSNIQVIQGQQPKQTEIEKNRKKRSRSPFKLFSKTEPSTLTSKTPRVSKVKPNTFSFLLPDNPFHKTPNRAFNFKSGSRPSINVRRQSRVNLSEALPNESNDQLDSSSLELVDEYFYGVRIFPGQDPSHVYCGWVVSNFRHYGIHFDENKVRKVKIQIWAENGSQSECYDRQNCYMLNAGQLYQEVNETEISSGRSNHGMFIGCHIDVSTATLTFTADGKLTKYRFKLEPGTKLYPAVFFEATSKECFQFEIGRTPTTLSLSAAILKSSEKHLTPQCPPRLKIQSLQRYQWARVGNISLKPHALKLSDIRGWSMLIEDPVSMLALYIPEEDRCVDILELIEHEKLLTFHAGTLALYGALCFQGNTRAAHIICSHVDEKQLLCAIQDQYISGILRSGFADLLISLHLELGVYARLLTQNEFIIPLGPELKSFYGLGKQMITSLSSISNVSIRPQIKQSKKVKKVESIKGLSSPYFPLNILKSFVMEALDDAVKKSNRPMRDPIGGSNTNLFVPLLKLIDKLLLIGSLDEKDLESLLILIDPETFDPEYDPKSENNLKGLLQMPLDEGVKLQMCYILHHLFDIHLHHKVGAIVCFSTQFVTDVQNDQKRRYTLVAQEELPAAVAAKKTKEFRSAPSDQMKLILDFKNLKEENFENCPCADNLRQNLFDIHEDIMQQTKLSPLNLDKKLEILNDQILDDGTLPWPQRFLALMRSVNDLTKNTLAIENKKYFRKREHIFFCKVITTVIKWAQEFEIENRELIRQMFYLLLRHYNGVGELMEALEKTYVTSAISKEDVIRLLEDLGTIRALLPVQMSTEEEQIMRETLWTLVMNKVFFQHPDLIRILRVHENIMDIMTNTLSKRVQGGSSASGAVQGSSLENQKKEQKTAIGDTSAMVVACCKFLCYFCRSSRQNQKAMFQHLDFLLENSNILLSRPSLRGSTPLDVASSSVMDNPDLALALREIYLEQIAIYLSKCGFQSNQELLDRGYPDLGWDPVEGERYLDFFRTCVWVNGESVEENANLVIRLLIRRPESLGPALRGEGEGLLQAIKDSITMSERMKILTREDINIEDEDYIDLGTAILNFYCGLVDLLGRCAPEPATIAAGKNECLRARAILKSLVLMQDLEGVLALRFNLENNSDSELLTGFVPAHKQSIVLFLERVYGIESQEIFFRLLEEAFLPDLRAAIMLEMQNRNESQMALALNRYLGNAVLPLLIKYSHFFANADNWASLMNASLHTIYRLSKIKVLTKGQRESVSDFLVALTREIQPSMLLSLLRKLTIDVSVLTEYSNVALRLLTLHYERCGKHYRHGGQNIGVASAEERNLTMLLFSNIFDSLAKMEYDPDLFNKALPCLTALAGALPPDYSFKLSIEDTINTKLLPEEGPYIPNPVNTNNIILTDDLINFIQRFAEHYHDLWAQRKFENNWDYGEEYNYDRKTHPRLKPYYMLTDCEKTIYKEPITDTVKTLLALGWKVEQKDATESSLSRVSSRIEARTSLADYNPQPVDTSSLTLSRDTQNLAERLAQNAHEIWALQTSQAMNGNIHPQMVPYDLLTDREKRKNRERSQEMLKYMQYEGFKVQRVLLKTGQEKESLEHPEAHISQSNTRFASSLLKKLIQYLDTAAITLKLFKPSSNFSRKNNFKESSRDVKFFSKVVLPLIEKLFSAHRAFFLNSQAIGSALSAGDATPTEKEMVVCLFCKLAQLLRSRFSAMGSEAKTAVNCLQVLIRATDAQTIVKNSPEFVKTSWLTFFNHAAEDLSGCIYNLRNGRFSHIRGTTMKTSSSLNYINLVVLPVLTAIFDHFASNEFGTDLLIDDLQVACYKILNNLYILGTDSSLTLNRKFIKTELDFHRPEIGNCLGAFATTFPVAFLEPQLNKNNPYCIHSRSEDYSLEAQGIMQELEASIPSLEDLMTKFEKYVESETKYSKESYVIDIILPLLCAYLSFWWTQGSDNVNFPEENKVTLVNNQHLNRMLKSVLILIKHTVNQPNNPWITTLAANTGMIVINSSPELLNDSILPLAEKIQQNAERIFQKEDILKSHLKSSSDELSEFEVHIEEKFSILVRDIYAFYPVLIKYIDFQKSHWLKESVYQAEKLYYCVASIFNIWSKSQFFRKEEQNFIIAHEIDNIALTMPWSGKPGRPVVSKPNTQYISGKLRKRKRNGKRDKERELASSLIVSALKRLLPIGLNLFAGREQELVQYAKDKFLHKENETWIFDYVKTNLNLPDKIDQTDSMSWQHYLYSKLGNTSSTLVKLDQHFALPKNINFEDKEKLQERLVERIIDMAKVLYGLHMIDHPHQKEKNFWRSCVSTQRKRAVIACFRMISLHQLPKHRVINIFLHTYNDLWLNEENIGHEQLIEDLTQSFEDHEQNKGIEEEEETKPDPLTQLMTTLSRKATTEHGNSIKEDKLYMKFASIFGQSCGGNKKNEEGENDEDLEEGVSIHEQELQKQKLLFQQSRLANRGVAEMTLLYISACKGVQSPMMLTTLKLGISILRGGNICIQQRMLNHLKEKKDVGFFTSISGLMNSSSVLDLDAFERNQKAESLGVSSDGTAGEKNMHDAEFTCALFRFIQLLCEGHNLEFQNYLRTQAGNTTTVNVIIITVDYLLRLQESMMDFYWHYSSKEVIDPSGKENFCRAITVAKQVFSTLTESIQGPCQGNQQALAHSRLWDAVGGFLFLFAHMQDKLSKNSVQLDLLIELLDLQKEMVVMMLSMLEGNVVNGTIGRQMVDTLVESASNVELILKFFDIFLKLKELVSSTAFQRINQKQVGWIKARDFKKVMEQQKIYSAEEIEYIMSCCEPNHEGLIDYRELTERFHNPAKEIGFNLAVLLTNLNEHMPFDPRLQRFLEIASSVLNYFEPFLGRIEIMGSAKRVERVYFEIKESSIKQWEKPQIKESKRAFFYSMITEGGDKEKLELFVNFCEDAIFEMQHAASISMEEDSRTPSASKYPYLGQDQNPPLNLDPLWRLLQIFGNKLINFLSYLTPKNVHKQINLLKKLSALDLILGIFKLTFKSFVFSNFIIYQLLSCIFQFVFRLMAGESIAGFVDEIETIPSQKALEKLSSFPPSPSTLSNNDSVSTPPLLSVLSASLDESQNYKLGKTNKELMNETNKNEIHDKQDNINSDLITDEKSIIVNRRFKENGFLDENKTDKLTTNFDLSNNTINEINKAEISTRSFLVTSFNLGNYAHRFICFLARNFYKMKYISLFIAFIINFILLFYKVSDASFNSQSSKIMKYDQVQKFTLNSKSNEIGEAIFDEQQAEWAAIEDKLFYLSPLIRILALIHSTLSIFMLIGYYHLKLPLAIFKREKEISRSMEFDGLYISHQQADDDMKAHWDKLVISTASFPVNYWDKFVKKRVRETYSEQYDYDQISNLLGMVKGRIGSKQGESKGWFPFIKSIDFQYQIWKAGVTITEPTFLYNLCYLGFSIFGNFNYFFFAAHLLDIAFAIKTLKTILQSVTHNGKQLVLTVMLLTIVVYIYTVIAFNFFRKFYVQKPEDEINEPDKKCHSMLTCFVFNIYQGVRAGGGIGDVIEPPDGDDYEAYRIIFDITFFFFVIVILLAIIQGLIIDAFGELRDQLQSVVDDMEANCFICTIGKDYFDKTPHGFETHVMKEHNLANYLFFFMHLINKPDTDYTGQETYVWELYQKRCWDFFPVGECFRKQYEDELSGTS